MTKKTLTLVRHAKSNWSNPEWTDLDRPLTKRGEEDLPIMSRLIALKIATPDTIYSSPAMRAITTARGYARELNYPESKIVIDQQIYERGSRHIIELLKYLPEEISSVMIFGHNPDITSLTSYFSGQHVQHVPTCGTVHLAFEIDKWKAIEEKNAELLFFEFPKMYREKKMKSDSRK